ncbi:hypothetical protein BOTCAL_0442g00040 [Botryotinia calthae]|uniref:Uncharacterized protein n=1 Tax=Botryotinia calthae TaxID=38488 RepID=A0A4Y8CND1_9HELO|nr:hypothetical protein BOTCAL_0442g00040 [Botryotinia calthae]
MNQPGHPASIRRRSFAVYSAVLYAAARSRALTNHNSINAVQVNRDAQAVDSAQTAVASYIQSINNARNVSGTQANYGTQTAEVNQASQVTNTPQATVAGLNSLASYGYTSGASTPLSFSGSVFSALPSPAGSIFTVMNDNIPRRPVLLRSQFAAQNRYDLHHRNPYHSSLPTQSDLRGNNYENDDGNYNGDDDTNEGEENNLLVNQMARLSLNEDMNTAIAEVNDNDVSYFTMIPEESIGFLQAPRNDVDAGINQLNLAINASGGSDTMQH